MKGTSSSTDCNPSGVSGSGSGSGSDRAGRHSPPRGRGVLSGKHHFLILLTLPLLTHAFPLPLALIRSTISTPSNIPHSKYMAMDALLTELQVYQGFAFVTLGIQFWEHVLTLQFEWDVYRGRIAWKHGMIGYILIRYSTWASLIPTLINICSRKPIDCQGSLNAILIALSTAVIFTSLVFIIRCIAVWQKNVWVILLLGSLWIAEAVMQLTSPFRMRSRWVQGACQTWFTTTAWRFNFAYLLAECTDIVTFALAAWKLRDVRTMGVGKVLFQQSVIYIGISTALNTICLVLIYLDLSPVLSYICSPFAMTISGILACRSFRDLQLVGQRANAELCFVKSSGLIWASQDVPGGGGAGGGPLRDGGRGGCGLSPGARVYNDEDGDCCTSTEPPHTGTESYDPRQIINCSRSQSPANHHHCPHHRPSSRGRVLTPLDAVQGRALGVAPPRSDWLTRSGLGEPTFRHRQIFTQVHPSGNGSGSGTGCCSSPLLGQSHKDNGCTFDGTKTSFMGFLLDDERARFESHAVSKAIKPRSSTGRAHGAPPRHHTSAPQISIAIDPTIHTASTIDNKSDTARGTIKSSNMDSLRYETEEEGLSTACGSSDEKKCNSAQQGLNSAGTASSSFINSWVGSMPGSPFANKQRNRKASVPCFDSVKMYDLERRVTTSNPAPAPDVACKNGHHDPLPEQARPSTRDSQAEAEANRTPRATTPGNMMIPRIVPRITPPRSADSVASQDQTQTSSLRCLSERQRQRERRVELQQQHPPTAGIALDQLSASHDALTLSDDIDIELEDAYRNKTIVDGSSHSFLSFPDASSDEEVNGAEGVAGSAVGGNNMPSLPRTNANGNVNTLASSRATLHTATSCASYETAPALATSATSASRCTSSDETTSTTKTSAAAPCSPPPAYIGTPSTATVASGNSGGAPPLRPLPPPPAPPRNGGNRSPTRERSYLKNQSDFWGQPKGGGASASLAKGNYPSVTGAGAGARPCTSDGASDILIQPAPVVFKEGHQ